MLALQVTCMSFAYRDAAPLFANVDLHLGPGIAGLVGENGGGKSTLLRILGGELRPDAGSVLLRPEGARAILCPQAVEVRDERIPRFALDDGGEASRLRGRLRLDPGAIERWPTLSPGERKRWQIGAALAEEPALLLLDEPTNHLDAEARDVLLAALRRFRGIGVLVSHDRALLDALTTSTIRVHQGRVTVHPGAYSEARAAWQREAEARGEARARAADEVHARARRLADERRARASAEQNLSSRRRMKDRHDHDARGMGAKVRAERAEARIGRMVGVRRAELERAEAALPAFEVDRSLGRSIFVDYARAPGARLASLDLDRLDAGERSLLADVHLVLRRDDRVWVAGPNGAGKSTLLRALLAAARLPPERVLFVPQDLGAEEARGVLRTIRMLPPLERGRVLSLVAALGVDPDRLLASASPSPGEARKAWIALGLGRHAWALVLDEPDNHLDLPSIERLESALGAYPGALLLVTHDEALARRTTRTTWRLEGGTIHLA